MYVCIPKRSPQKTFSFDTRESIKVFDVIRWHFLKKRCHLFSLSSRRSFGAPRDFWHILASFFCFIFPDGYYRFGGGLLFAPLTEIFVAFFSWAILLLNLDGLKPPTKTKKEWISTAHDWFFFIPFVVFYNCNNDVFPYCSWPRGNRTIFTISVGGVPGKSEVQCLYSRGRVGVWVIERDGFRVRNMVKVMI